jgi:hypothetical protein
MFLFPCLLFILSMPIEDRIIRKSTKNVKSYEEYQKTNATRFRQGL